MSVDGYVQVAPDSTGKKIDNSELTRADATVVERQRTVISDDDNPGAAGAAEVRDKKLQVEDRTLEALERIELILLRLEEMLYSHLHT